MLSKDYADVISGMVIVSIGTIAAVYAFIRFPIGSLARMGPGMFPVAIGVFLIVLGAIIAITGWRRQGHALTFDIRPFVTISAALAAFAVLVERAGMVPACMALVLIATIGNPHIPPIQRVILGAVLSFGVTTLLRVTLELPVHYFAWRF